MNKHELTMVKRHLLNGYSTSEIAEKLRLPLADIVEVKQKQDEKIEEQQLRKIRAIERANRPKKVKKDINARFRGLTV
ncbi:hypothetical protein LDY07_00655 [Acinetobacter baumannii]|uniref:hypothetical protein n=1 Tax=Acinetobacter baumannii TaxID=470 RepID=UPI001CDC3924|nr:hypothetical protein [Acinetobacter baumannii]MCA4413018.1 hypothetical protein [Acinetobacter baumannii]